MSNSVIPSDPDRVDLTVVEDGDFNFLVVKTELGGAFAPKPRVIAKCESRPDADAIVHWMREGLRQHARDLQLAQHHSVTDQPDQE